LNTHTFTALSKVDYNLGMVRENIILTGFMGTGKTAVGKALAAQLGYKFVDTDALIEQRAGQSIAEIFRVEGESAFRAWEAGVAEELAGGKEMIISTGGGMMLDRENAAHLAQTGRVFCLTASAAEIVRRLEHEVEVRPLLAVPDPAARVSELLAQRASGYAQFRQINTEGREIAAIAQEIRALMETETIAVSSPEGPYEVAIGSQLLPHVGQIAGIHGPFAIISDSNVGPLFAEQCKGDWLLTIPAGEANKTLATANALYGQLLDCGFDRQGTIVALGGGVVGDVAGFVAATYMRGVDFVQCPTSLLAMVDASVGGKTGVDLPEGKNLVGAFKQPRAVIADLDTLVTLPAVEFSAGMAEVIKSGIIADPELFALAEAYAPQLMDPSGRAHELLTSVVSKSVQVKRDIVEADPFEHGRRAWLNLGHTFGHAIEQVSGYAVRHGDAVAMGLVAAAHLSAELGFCDSALESRIGDAALGVRLPIRIPEQLEAEALLAAMSTDKKRVTGRLRFVLPRAIGEVFVTEEPQPEQVLATLRHRGAG
jgi:shikimate kinase/3-dehydroquinate synthase